MDRKELVAADRRHLWRPYTSSEDHASLEPLVVTGAEGPWLEVDDGRRLLDGTGSWWCTHLGHRHPRLVAALRRQAEALPHVAFAGATHEPAVALATELVEVAPPGLSRVFYSDDGSTAVEVGLKMAFQYWQQNGRPSRTRFLALPGAYHGDTLGAMAVGDLDEFNGLYRPLFFDVHRPRVADLTQAVEALVAELRAHGDTVAGVVVEPMVQGAAGMRTWPADALRALAEATREADTFLIADEVFTGFGRTGPMWGCDHAGVGPDILCLAKGMTGGLLPFAATLATERVYDGFRGDGSRCLMHGHTFYGNPLGAAVAREVLAIYRDDQILVGVAERARRVAEAVATLAALPGVRAPRALGMIGAVDLGAGGYRGRAGWRVAEAALPRGLLLRPLGDTVYVTPALNIPLADLDALLGAWVDAVREVVTAPSGC